MKDSVSLVFISPSHRASHPHQLPVPIRSSDGHHPYRATPHRTTHFPAPPSPYHLRNNLFRGPYYSQGRGPINSMGLAFPIPRSWRHQWERGWEQHHGWGRGPYRRTDPESLGLGIEGADERAHEHQSHFPRIVVMLSANRPNNLFREPIEL